MIARYRGRVYLFELNPTLSIDSSNVGNESRFINHDPIRANSEAGSKSEYAHIMVLTNVLSVRLVNGEHRIGIFARESRPWRYLLEDNTHIFVNSENFGTWC